MVQFRSQRDVLQADSRDNVLFSRSRFDFVGFYPDLADMSGRCAAADQPAAGPVCVGRLESMQAHLEMPAFDIGAKVSFDSPEGCLFGTLIQSSRGDH